MLHTAAAMATARERPSFARGLLALCQQPGVQPTLALTKNTRSFTKTTCTGRNSPARRVPAAAARRPSASSAKPCSRLK